MWAPTVQLRQVDFDGSKPFYWISPLLFTLNPSELRNTDLSFWKAGLYRVARMQKKIRVFILITSSMRSARTRRTLTLETLCWAFQCRIVCHLFLPQVKRLDCHTVIKPCIHELLHLGQRTGTALPTSFWLSIHLPTIAMPTKYSKASLPAILHHSLRQGEDSLIITKWIFIHLAAQ